MLHSKIKINTYVDTDDPSKESQRYIKGTDPVRVYGPSSLITAAYFKSPYNLQVKLKLGYPDISDWDEIVDFKTVDAKGYVLVPSKTILYIELVPTVLDRYMDIGDIAYLDMYFAPIMEGVIAYA